MRASRSARVMLLCINGKSRGACATSVLWGVGLLFTVVITILNHNGALAVFPFQSPLVGGENILGLFEPDYFDVLAHQPEGVGEIADVLVLRMQWTHGANPGPDDHLGPVA